MVRPAHVRRPLVGTLAALLLGATAALGGATPASAAAPAAPGTAAPAPAVDAPDFEGIVALSNCSGAVVRMPHSTPQDPALVLTNGHCLEAGMPEPGVVVVDEPSNRTFTLLDAVGGNLATLRATRIAYATMTGTDVALYELTRTYEDIDDRWGIEPLEVDSARSTEGTPINVVSGYWKRVYTCELDGFVHELHEGGWVMKDSLRYTAACDTIGGTSGSPVVDTATGKVVGVNNTGNNGGRPCILNNPCEVDENGGVTARPGINYGQQTHELTRCTTVGNKIDLDLPGCGLARP
ncbi:serine protease [Streptomyces sp. 549]|uniref:S1 family peptidase n=1 Tax=Streptomyces sp. 549 TaxID=3049076 RepID=UPI0024C28BE7|nr:serine protease [Streptomyces sp. 549]MDK1476977.1 serine protease [Streptomyces sp. 549]